MDEKFLAVVYIGALVRLALSNSDKFEGTVVSIDNDLNCVELYTDDGIEYVTLTSLSSFKIIKTDGDPSKNIYPESVEYSI